MHHLDEFESGRPTSDISPEPDVMEYVHRYGASLPSPDVKFGLQLHLPLVPPAPKSRGTPSFGRKGDVVYDVDRADDDVTAISIIPNPFGIPTVDFVSVYADVADQLRFKPECSLCFRHERVVKHPVSLGCFKKAGLSLAPPKAPSWSIYWGARWKESQLTQLRDKPQSRVNHFAKTFLIGRKDNLAKVMRKAAVRWGGPFNCTPRTFLLPADKTRLEARMDREPEKRFVIKPAASSRGRGITLFCGKDQIPDLERPLEVDDDAQEGDDGETVAMIVQEYIDRPLLINGFKVDFRIYCVVTSFSPLLCYIYNEGLVRFATSKYAGAENCDEFAHLTNFSVNKTNAAFVKPSGDCDESASKWSLHALQAYLQSDNVAWDELWSRICTTAASAMVAVAEDVASASDSATMHRFSCFELYGVDVMVDETHRAHLIEVNILPSLGCGSALDKHIKGHLVADTLTLVGIPSAESKENPRISSNDLCGDRLDSADYFSTCGEATRLLLSEVENQLSRARGFSRVIPSPSLKCFDVALTSVPNLVLRRWEESKSRFSDVDREAAVKWLRGEGPFPGQIAKLVKAAKPPPQPKPVVRTRSLSRRLEPTQQDKTVSSSRRKSEASSVSSIKVQQFQFVAVKQM